MENKISKFNTCCFTLSYKDIIEFDTDDNGQINNVISGIRPNCYGARLFDDEIGLTIEYFFINNDHELKGDIIRLEINDPEYFQLLFQFAVLISATYKNINEIDTFNTFQIKLRTFLEKRGFATVTNIELKTFDSTLHIAAIGKRGIHKIELIEKKEFYRNYLGNRHLNLTKDLSHVYLMINEDTSLIKIGTSINPGYRERTLHSKEPAVHLVAAWQCHKAVEKELHTKYSDNRVRGEWFRLNLNELEEIEKFMNNLDS